MKTRFYHLKFGDKFTLVGKILQKESTFRAVSAFGRRVEVTVWPWTKVRAIEERRVNRLPNGLRDIQRSLDRQTNRDLHICYPPHKDDERTGPSC